MKERVETITLVGTRLAIALRPPLPADTATVAVALAMRALERYPVLAEVAVACDGTEHRLSRPQAEQLLLPDGLAVVRERGRRHVAVARAVAAFLASRPAAHGARVAPARDTEG